MRHSALHLLQSLVLKLKTFTNEVREIGRATGIAPFIVIPGDDLDEVEALRHGREAIDDGIKCRDDPCGIGYN